MLSLVLKFKREVLLLVASFLQLLITMIVEHCIEHDHVLSIEQPYHNKKKTSVYEMVRARKQQKPHKCQCKVMVKAPENTIM